MICTSPPFWGLRKYSGNQDLIWGGDENCEHEWDIGKISLLHENRNFQRGTQEEVLATGSPLRHTHKTSELRAGSCSLCGAWKGAYGLEPTPEMYVQHTIEILREIRRVLRKDGVVFWDIGDSYASKAGGYSDNGSRGNSSVISAKTQAAVVKGKRIARGSGRWGGGNNPATGCLKEKDLCLIPFRVAIAAQEDGWWIRSVIIWSKPNHMPESVRDRPTESHEYILMLTKSAKYYWDQEAVREEYTEPLNRWGGDTLKRETKKTAAYKDEVLHLSPSSAMRAGNPIRPNSSGRNICSVWEFPTQPFSDWVFDYEHADYVGDDGKPYILSEDCPVHWRHPEKGIQRRDACGEQLNHQSLGKTDSTNGLAQELKAEYASTHSPDEAMSTVANGDEQIPESIGGNKTSSLGRVEPEKSDRTEGTQKIPASNLDYESQKYVPSAIGHSKQNHKTAPVPLTNPPYKPSEKTGGHIDSKLKQPLLSGLDQHTGESNSEVGLASNEKELNPLAGTLFHNARTSHSNYKCSCRISQVSHFAVFPEKLPEICIKAATPEVGCCSKCGAPWERIVKRTGHTNKCEPAHVPNNSPTKTDSTGWAPMSMATEEWQPTCKCNADKVPSTVLDPFAGAGTTGLVATRLGRRCVMYDTSEQYCELNRERNKQTIMDIVGIQGVP